MNRQPFTPRGFLIWAGSGLTVVGVLGALGILSQTFAPGFWVDAYQATAYLVLGIFALLAVYLTRLKVWLKPYHRRIVQVYGAIALLAGLYGFVAVGNPSPNVFGLANFEVSEFLLYLILATWAFAAGYYPVKEAPVAQPEGAGT